MERRRKSAGPPARNAWDSTLDRLEHAEPTQGGEVDEGEEDPRRRAAAGRDSETGDGGYGGDAVEAGYEEAISQPDRPLDDEIHGDPRTHEGEPYPDEAKTSVEGQTPIGESGEIDMR